MDPTKATPEELQSYLETLQEAGRVISGSNLKLLRAIESGTFRRVGGTEDVRVDIRVIGEHERGPDGGEPHPA